jgi:magnesium transporter
MESKPWGFILAVIISVAISAIAWGIFRHKRLV